MIYLECREANRDLVISNGLFSPTFMRHIIEARYPYGPQNKCCTVFAEDSRIVDDKCWVYLCDDILNSYSNGESIQLSPCKESADSTGVGPFGDYTLAISICGSFIDSLNCYLIDGDHYKAISYQTFARFFGSCVESFSSQISATPFTIHLLMPYGARITMPHVPLEVCQNHYYCDLLSNESYKDLVIQQGLFSTFAYRFCSELRNINPNLYFRLYAAIGDFNFASGSLLHETEDDFALRLAQYKKEPMPTTYEHSNLMNYPMFYGFDQGAVILYDFSEVGTVCISGGSTILYHGDIKPSEFADIESSTYPWDKIATEAGEEGEKLAEDQEDTSEHDKYLKKDS